MRSFYTEWREAVFITGSCNCFLYLLFHIFHVYLQDDPLKSGTGNAREELNPTILDALTPSERQAAIKYVTTMPSILLFYLPVLLELTVSLLPDPFFADAPKTAKQLVGVVADAPNAFNSFEEKCTPSNSKTCYY
jgi:hypothetical protein